jgi:hypothetical protein
MKHEQASLTESLKQSAANRSAILKRFGFIPSSVLKLSFGALTNKLMYRLQGEATDRAVWNSPAADEKLLMLKKVGYKGKQTASNRKTGRGTKTNNLMSAELVQFFIKYYAAPGQVYLDPFMAHSIQMQVAKMMGLHYYGQDLCEQFYDYALLVKKKIDDGETKIVAAFGDSRVPDKKIPDGVGDFCFTSPPYWDINWYSDDPRQLGLNRSYPDFIDGMTAVARAWLPKFKPGAVCVVNVNDFRKDHRFYSYHSDTIQLFQAAGWEIHDQWIVEGLVGGMARAFGVDFNMQKIAPKAHEYCMVFRKPL